MLQLSPEDKLILASVKVYPDGADLERLDGLIPFITDWDYLSKSLVERGIGPLLYKKLSLLANAILIPDEVKSKLQQAYYRTLSRSMVLYDAFRKVAEALTANGIQVIALKGGYLSEALYNDIALRQFSDIDLLVRPEEGVKSLAILSGLGFKSHTNSVSELIGKYTDFVHYPPMILNEVSVEIHIKLHQDNKKYHINVDDFFNKAQPVIVHQVSIHTLQLYDLLIHLCVHLDKHFWEGGHIQFTCFNDVTNVLNVHGKEIEWTAFAQRCRENQCEELVFRYLLLVNRYFHAPLPESIQNKYSMLLTQQDETMFYKHLHGYKGVQMGSGTSTHWRNIRKIKGILPKIQYFMRIVFPPKEFMLQAYQMKNPHLYWFYYPYRFWTGVKGFFRVIFKK